jgi:hypothetical protein
MVNTLRKFTSFYWIAGNTTNFKVMSGISFMFALALHTLVLTVFIPVIIVLIFFVPIGFKLVNPVPVISYSRIPGW